VKYNTTAETIVLAGAGENALGVLQNNPVSGEAAVVAIGGKSKVIAGGTVAGGAIVSSDAAGKAVTSATSGHYILGVTARGGASNNVIEVVLDKNGKI